MSEQAASKTSLVRTAAAIAATILLLGAPDVLFRLAGYEVVSMFKEEAIATVVILAILLTLMPSRRGRLAVIAFLVVGQLIWLGSLRYFGAVLRPDQIMLLPSEVVDTALGVAGDFATLLPVVALSVAVAGGLFALHAGRASGGIVRLRGAGVVLCILLIGIAVRWSVWKEAIVKFPGLQSASVIGTYHASVAAVRFTLAPAKAAPGLRPADQPFELVPIDEEPVTVLFIMGESINPSRLSLFGGKDNTTPILASWRSAPPSGLTLMPRIGFASGVATLGSVPAFIRTSFMPVEGERRGLNLFELAGLNKFKSWYFSAQNQRFVSTAGGAPGAALIETEDNNAAILERIRDDRLVELVRAVSGDEASRRFIFVHQRVNHSPYEVNCAHVAQAINTISKEGLSKDDARRAGYDNGLRCWDRSVARLVEALQASPGALHIFVTSDHNELMGEDGLWGHLHPTIRTAAVPLVLLTNRPESEVARRFQAMSPASFYNLSRVVTRALGVELIAPPEAASTFYMNKTLPFGMAGYMQVAQLAPWRFKVRSFDRNGAESPVKMVELPDLGAAEAFAQGSAPVATAPDPTGQASSHP